MSSLTRLAALLNIQSRLPAPMGVPFRRRNHNAWRLDLYRRCGRASIRTYDVAAGRELWKARLPAGGQATPMSRRALRSGRQIVLIATGGKPTLHTTPGTKLVAFALPN